MLRVSILPPVWAGGEGVLSALTGVGENFLSRVCLVVLRSEFGGMFGQAIFLAKLR